MRVVLDTNVFVAAGFNKESSSARIVDAVELGRLEMVWNRATCNETRKIVSRIPRLSWARFKDLFRPEWQFHGPTSPRRFGTVADPDDRKFAALAEAASAILVTNDVHLLSQKDVLSVAVMTPGQFWREKGAEIDRST